MQTLQAPSECADVSFLLETNHLEEKEVMTAKQKFIIEQRDQLQKERQKLLDFATELAKQVHHCSLSINKSVSLQIYEMAQSS